jgi:hypothetical protein
MSTLSFRVAQLFSGASWIDGVEPDTASKFSGSHESLYAGCSKQRSDVGVHPKQWAFGSIEWPLVEPHHEWHRCVEEAIETSHDVSKNIAEVGALIGIKRWKIFDRSRWRKNEFVRPSRGEWDPCCPLTACDDDLVCRRRCERCINRRTEFGECNRGNNVEGIDLSVRMTDRCPNFGTSVFEDEYIGDIVSGTELCGAICPHVYDCSSVFMSEISKRRVVVSGVEHDLGTTAIEWWPAIRK